MHSIKKSASGYKETAIRLQFEINVDMFGKINDITHDRSFIVLAGELGYSVRYNRRHRWWY